jgi:Flp pilus assembly protein TadG
MNQRGSLSIEFAILVPALVLLFGVTVGGARAWLARSGVEQLAGAAARAASLERTAPEAARAASQLAAQQAKVGGLSCEVLTVKVDTAAFARPAGTVGQVTAVVTCDVPLSDVLVPGWPGTLPVTASSSAVIDSFRGRK